MSAKAPDKPNPAAKPAVFPPAPPLPGETYHEYQARTRNGATAWNVAKAREAYEKAKLKTETATNTEDDKPNP
jgi:hypothetical protein